MQLIRCTKKLQKEIGLKKSDLQTSPPSFSFLGQWHANLIYINRRKCVLFANDKTLFNFIAPDVSRAQIRELDSLFRSWLIPVLKHDGLGASIINRIVTEYETLSYASSDNRSVLGSLNDLAFHYEHAIMHGGGLHSASLPDIIYELNRTPMSPLKLVFPDKEIRALYATEL